MLISMVGFGFQSFAQGNLLVTPTRVLFEGNKQMEELNLLNMGNETTTYSISFVQKRMKEDGSFVNIEKPDSGQLFADPYLRIFPREVTLAPGEPQVIMLQCRRKADMIAGEYRSHLFFRSEKDYKPLASRNSARDTTQLNVQLIPIFGMSIPIIIRCGAVNVNVGLSNLKLENQQDTLQILHLNVNRTGNISTYGDIIIDFIPTHGKSYQIGIVTGLGVYTNINQRHVDVKLKKPLDRALTNGKLKVQYINTQQTKRTTYAESELEVN